MNCPGDGCTWKNQSEAIKHMDYVSQRIKSINPDIINFCEVEGCDELTIVKNNLDSSYTPYLKKGTDTSTGQNVGMLTRIDPLKSLYRTELKQTYPIPGSKCGYTGANGTTGVSKHFITEFEINKIHIAFISAHLIAIPTDPARCAQREGQASVLQNIIYDYIKNGYEVIMIGDFNDYDAEILDINSNIPNSMVLDILKGLNGEYAGKYQLNSIAKSIPQNDRYSDWWDSDNNCNTLTQSDFSMIDHILVTDLIQTKVANAFIYHEYDEYCGKYDSDHFPVVIDFLL
jgi:exonuclease III